jgi:hypothetical protein
MSVHGADRSSEPAQFRTELRLRSISRKILGSGRSVGPLLYLISLGLIASWTLGVFFGVGFFFLVQRSATLVSGLGVRDTDFSVGLAESTWPPQFGTSRPLRSAEADLGEDAGDHIADLPIGIDRLLPYSSAGSLQRLSKETQSAVADRSQPIAPLQGQPFDATGPPTVAQSADLMPLHGRNQRHPSGTRMPRPHAPLKAIHDLLQRHARLLK